MTLTFETDNDAVAFALERIIRFARENQYLFVANCIWWIAGVIGLDKGLTIYIDNLYSRIPNDKQQSASLRISTLQQVSPVPRDIGRSVSADPGLNKIEEELRTSSIGQSQGRLGKPKQFQQNKVSKRQRKKLARQRKFSC